MKIIETELEGVVIVETDIFRDRRGTFMETFSEREFARLVKPVRFVQDNESLSQRDVVRGLHFQKKRHAQAKLVRVVKGSILDVALDMRRASATFGRWVAVELSADNRRQLFIPRGFAHGFVARERNTTVAYKCDNYYAPESDGGVLWNDPSLGIPWNIARKPVVSKKDAALPLFTDAYYF